MRTTCTAVLALISLSALALPVRAQTCPDNQYPVTFVNAAGQPVPTFVENGEVFARFGDFSAYMALSPQMPSGVYYVQVSDIEITTVLATSAQLDRIFEITNNGGVISVVRLSSTQGLPPPGVGLNGIGQSVPLFPLAAPPATSSACRFKAWIGTCYSKAWNPSTDPLGLPFGVQNQDGAGGCCVRSFARFLVGDGSGLSTVTGTVFNDLSHDGVQNGGEPGLPGIEVRLVSGGPTLSDLTDANGLYEFAGVAAGNYTVHVIVPAGQSASTPTSVPIQTNACAAVDGPDFGLFSAANCDGHTPGFWSNPNGRAIVLQNNLLSRLPSLNLRTANGSLFTTTNYATFRTWLLGANATNMAYKLSSHVVAMDFNVAHGFVDGSCVIHDPILGNVSISSLLSQAVTALGADGYTPTGDPNRTLQERLKNALDDANNDLNWN